jgi:hypothetical protein
VERPTVIRAKLARATRFGAPPEAVASLRRDYHAARAREYLCGWLAGDHAPTADQRRELAELLLGQGGTSVAA